MAKSEKPTSIRGLARRDLAAIVRLDTMHTGEAKPAYWKRLVGQFLGAKRSRERVNLVAEHGGTLVGFLFADVRAFEFGSEPCGWILEVGVDPKVLRLGVGTALLREATARLRAAGLSTIRTMVRRHDVPVLTFFRTNGFAGGPYVQLELTADADV